MERFFILHDSTAEWIPSLGDDPEWTLSSLLVRGTPDPVLRELYEVTAESRGVGKSVPALLSLLREDHVLWVGSKHDRRTVSVGVVKELMPGPSAPCRMFQENDHVRVEAESDAAASWVEGLVRGALLPRYGVSRVGTVILVYPARMTEDVKPNLHAHRRYASICVGEELWDVALGVDGGRDWVNGPYLDAVASLRETVRSGGEFNCNVYLHPQKYGCPASRVGSILLNCHPTIETLWPLVVPGDVFSHLTPFRHFWGLEFSGRLTDGIVRDFGELLHVEKVLRKAGMWGRRFRRGGEHTRRLHRVDRATLRQLLDVPWARADE